MFRHARTRRALKAGGLCLLLAGGAGLALDRVFPPDLSRLSESSVMVLDADGGLLRAFTTSGGLWRLPARPDQVDPLYLAMLLAYEDKRFRHHPGVDPLAVARALGQAAAERRVVSGASTLTMQTARLLQPRPRDLAGKLVETARALQLETRYGKDEILAMYLTLAPFGGNLEGVRAAVLAYFGKAPRRLTPGEAALLVALPQSPTRLRPDRFPERARAARDKVLAAMEARAVLTPRQAAEARNEPVPALRRPLPFHAPHLARRLIARDGPAVRRTTIDGALQAALETLVRQEQDALEPKATAAVLVVETRSRRVLAYAGSSDFFDDARSGQIDMAQAVRSPGSALKPFIYGMAFDDLLIHPETIVADLPTRFGDYRPENFRRSYHGEVTVREALQQSLNVPAVAVLDGVGPGRFAARLRAAGLPLRLTDPSGPPGLPLALGGVGITLFDLVTLYTGLANGGEVAPLVLTETGAPDAAAGGRIFGSAAAWYVARILEAAPPPVDFVAAGQTRQDRRIAFKTGTSYGFRDAWAAGYDGAYTVGVWVGRPDGAPSPGRYGRNTAAPLLFRVFGLLPDQGARPGPRARPAGVIAASNGELPAGLARFGRAAASVGPISHALGPPLTITFPPDGAVVELERDGLGLGALPLTAEGGEKPLSWLVNGRAVAAPPHRRQATWRPDGEGFVRITVIDAKGATATAEVLLK
ncbi:MAG: penicillin-binding protein 1C [Rhodospirillales bacterium]|nr:penicillin-binding protein 1C [Rhodospirillales bacterium]MDH3918297.1 penicillin-binding protein 1C [Rhodospirillales bacterium]MDH3967491.1 penicillin-binding protein 1C [Rhodospirillales bacterium]